MSVQKVFPGPYRVLPMKIRDQVVERDKFTCQRCQLRLPSNRLNVHHITAVRKGGSDELKNLVTLCKRCHTMVEEARKSNYAYPVSDHTFIQTSKKLTAKLHRIGHHRESYEDIIWRLIREYEKCLRKA